MSLKILNFIIVFTFFCSGCTIYAQDHTSSIQKFIYKKRNFNNVYRKGYRVVLYNGDENKTREIYQQFKEDFKNIFIKLSYVSPDWKVLTEFYSSKIEAENTLIFIKEKYPNSKILQN